MKTTNRKPNDHPTARKTYNLYDLIDITDGTAFRDTIGCEPLTATCRYLAPKVSRLASDTLDALNVTIGFALAIAGFVVALLTATFAPMFVSMGYAPPTSKRRPEYAPWTSSPSRPVLAVESTPSFAEIVAETVLTTPGDAEYETWSDRVSRTDAEQESIDAEIERIAAKYGIGRSEYVPYSAPMYTPTETIDGYTLPVRPIELPVLMSPVPLPVLPSVAKLETVEVTQEAPSVKMGKPGKTKRQPRSAAKMPSDARKPVATQSPVETVETPQTRSLHDSDPVRTDVAPLFTYKRPNAGARGGYRPVSSTDPETAPRFTKEGRKYVMVSGPKA